MVTFVQKTFFKLLRYFTIFLYVTRVSILKCEIKTRLHSRVVAGFSRLLDVFHQTSYLLDKKKS